MEQSAKCNYIPTSSSYEEIEKNFSVNFRDNLRKARNKLCATRVGIVNNGRLAGSRPNYPQRSRFAPQVLPAFGEVTSRCRQSAFRVIR